MLLRTLGFGLYFALYILLYIVHFGSNAPWALVVGGASSILFGALAGTGLGQPRRWIGFTCRLFGIVYVIVAVLALLRLLPIHFLMLCNGLGLLCLAVELWGLQRWRYRIVSYGFVIAGLVSIPVPGLFTTSPAAPSDYSVPGKTGVLLAPNLTERIVSAGEWAFQPRDVRAANDGNVLLLSETSAQNAEDFGDVFRLPFEVPEHYYQWDGASGDPHALMKTLAVWNEASESDVTQGQTVMGIGAIAPNGKILTVGDMNAYTLAALEAKPKVFFVPIEAYAEVKELSQNQLVVPVSHFEEVLYFLSEPVEFWPLLNFGLFCH